MPVPSYVRARVLHTMEPFEDAGQFRIGDAATGVAYRELHAIATPVEGDGDFAVDGELERVGEEVEDDFLPHVPIDINRLGQRGAVHDAPQPCLLDSRSEHAGDVGGRRCEVRRLVAGVDASGL